MSKKGRSLREALKESQRTVVHVGCGMPTLWTVWGPGAGTQGDHANLQACFRRADIAEVDATLDLAKVAAKAMRSATVVMP